MSKKKTKICPETYTDMSKKKQQKYVLSRYTDMSKKTTKIGPE